MQASEIRRCDLCRGGLCPDLPIFNRVRFERFGLDAKAMNERIGLHHLFNGRAGPALIEAFAPSSEVAILIHEPAELLICERCACATDVPVQALAEIAHERLQQRKAHAQEAANDDEGKERRRSDRQVAGHEAQEDRRD